VSIFEWLFLGMPVEVFVLFLVVGGTIMLVGGISSLFQRMRRDREDQT
jgi:hypothetical protein